MWWNQNVVFCQTFCRLPLEVFIGTYNVTKHLKNTYDFQSPHSNLVWHCTGQFLVLRKYLRETQDLQAMPPPARQCLASACGPKRLLLGRRGNPNAHLTQTVRSRAADGLRLRVRVRTPQPLRRLNLPGRLGLSAQARRRRRAT